MSQINVTQDFRTLAKRIANSRPTATLVTEFFVGYLQASLDISAIIDPRLTAFLKKANMTEVPVIEYGQYIAGDPKDTAIYVIVKRNAWNWSTDGVDGAVSNSGDMIDRISGSHVWLAVSHDEKCAELLGDELLDAATKGRKDIQHEACFADFRPVSLGGPEKLREDGTLWGIPCAVSYVIDRTYRIVPLGPPPNQLDVSVNKSPVFQTPINTR